MQLHLTSEALKAAVVGQAVYSDVFAGGGSEWELRVVIGGDSEEHKGFISIFLVLVSDEPRTANFTISAAGKRVATSNTFEHEHSGGNSCWGWADFLTHKRATDWLILHGGQLEIAVTVRPAGGVVAKPVPPPAKPLLPIPPPGLSNELRALLSSGARSDCALLCGGERFPAHTFVLTLRSAVFAAQLSPPPGLGAGPPDLSSVPVPPEIRPPVLRKLLEYVYGDEDAQFADVDEARGGSLTVTDGAE